MVGPGRPNRFASLGATASTGGGLRIFCILCIRDNYTIEQLILRTRREEGTHIWIPEQ